MYPAYAGQMQMVQLLLERGANVNHLDAEGSSPLLWAARGAHKVSIMELLGAL